MTPKTQSVCKHTTREEAMACPRYRRLVDVPDLAGELFHGSEYFEPVAEPASTGEQPPTTSEIKTMAECVHLGWLRSREEGAQELLKAVFALRAARPSEPSAPQPTHCQECHEVITFNDIYKQWFHADGTSTYPKCTRPKTAPQTSAEPLRKCTCPTKQWTGSEPNDSTCELTEEEHAQLDKAAAPQPVSGDAPGIKVTIYDPIAYLQELYANMGKRGECEICLKLQFCIEVLKEKLAESAPSPTPSVSTTQEQPIICGNCGPTAFKITYDGTLGLILKCVTCGEQKLIELPVAAAPSVAGTQPTPDYCPACLTSSGTSHPKDCFCVECGVPQAEPPK